MNAKLLVGIIATLVSVSCVAQVTPAATTRPPLSTSAGLGMNYWSGDWQRGDINRWGPCAWATLTVWHDVSIIAEGHSMIAGGSAISSNYKYFAGAGGVIWTSDYWGRFQPFVKGEAGIASLTHPGNGTGHFHDSSNIWELGGGVEYHTWGNLWTHVGYSYDFFPNFHDVVTNQNHYLNPRGFTFGETLRFGPSGSRF